MKRFKIFIALSAVAFFCVSSRAYMQQRPLYEIHSMLLYNFIKYIEWPASDKTGDFVIGVIGDENVYNALNKWYGTKTKGTQKIIIKKFDGALDVTKCHVVYIASKKSNEFDLVKNIASGQHILIVTDKPGLGKKGSNINFKMVNGKLKFELNKSSIEKSQLKVSSQLEKMAIII